jgi:hypothetical protein
MIIYNDHVVLLYDGHGLLDLPISFFYRTFRYIENVSQKA